TYTMKVEPPENSSYTGTTTNITLGETDTTKRVDIYTEFQRLVNKNVPWISVALGDSLRGLRSRVNGYQSWLLPYTRYWTIWTDD
ncbi:MAG: hypothetical protein ABEI52_06755, partial [Halobacteriaceae archaeon]